MRKIAKVRSKNEMVYASLRTAILRSENAHFHQLICDWAETPLVRHMMDKVLQHWDRLRSYLLKDVFQHRVATAQRDHWRIYEAIRARDVGLLEKVVHEHNQSALAAYLQHLQTVNAD